MLRKHRFHHALQRMRLRRDDVPQDRVVETKILVSNAIADALDLRPRLSRVVR